jgi:hypothetical protein
VHHDRVQACRAASLGIWLAIVGLPILLVIGVGVVFSLVARKLLRRGAPSPWQS